MWETEKPKESGWYWFYGDPFYGELPHDEEKGINPYTPEMHMVEITFVREGFITMASQGAFCYKPKGMFFTNRIEEPEKPNK